MRSKTWIYSCAVLLAILNCVIERPSLSAPPQSGIKPTPPYNFRVIAQKGEVIAGYKILNFLPSVGSNVAINEKGQTAFVAPTNKGLVVFRDRAVIAAVGTTQEKEKITELGVPTINAKGDIAYMVVYASHPKTICIAVNKKCVLRSGMQIKGLGKRAAVFYEPIYDDLGNLIVGAKTEQGQLVALVNGIYSPKETQRMQLRNAHSLTVSNQKGQMIFVNHYDDLQSIDNNQYPIMPSAFAMNGNGQIIAYTGIDDFRIFPYNYVRQRDGILMDNQIPHLKLSVAQALHIIPDIVGGEKEYSLMTKLDSDSGRLLSYNPGAYSSQRGWGVAINNRGQIAFFVQHGEIGKVAGRDGFYPLFYRQYLLLGTPTIDQPDPITLVSATTPDAQNISVDYFVNPSGAKQPIRFVVYRANKPDLDDASVQATEIGAEEISTPQFLTVGAHKHESHTEVKLKMTDPLIPDTAHPYIIVKAICNGVESTTYFRKWMLGVISHGYEIRAAPWDKVGLGIAQDFTIPQWESQMANSLKIFDRYDDVIPFDWMHTCAIPESGYVDKESERLESLVSQWISEHQQHTGDVVDLHLIGHGRGAVIVSKVLTQMSKRSMEQPSHFGGSYIQVTLLDPHPSNNELEVQSSDLGVMPDLDLDDISEMIGKIFELKDKKILADTWPTIYHMLKFTYEHVPEMSQVGTDKFHSNVKDSPVAIPPGVKKLDVWWQHTKAKTLKSNFQTTDWILNPWGMVSSNSLQYPSDVNFQVEDLTQAKLAGVEAAISHDSVPLYYQQQIVETGHLNRK